MNEANAQLMAIFAEALECPSAAERSAYLERACGGTAELRVQAEALLRAYFEAGDFLRGQSSLPGMCATVDEPRPTEAPGTVIGPYKLLQQIGEGGMGTVFMAEQEQPIRRKVALKVIKPGMDSRQVIARFEAERQALAMMDHVNIARVFDGGATETGRPYFVMELVHGVPITKYCDDNQLTPRQRLELFVPVCQAIQHAHQKGIIHRDVKPSNVMITLYDGKPVPKVIDFGVAKATEQKLTERTLFTQYGTMVGTFEYMSPEQAEMSALGVDTRSDIYSLGVLLYELLTGSTPLTHKRIKAAAYGEILRLIKEEEPPKPSTRLSDSGEALASISANRHTEPAKLSKLMRGELDWIVMKTLEKDRNRRYETANGFAADVQRYLHDEPVLAGAPSAWYRFGKFARRKKAALAVAGLILFFIVLLGGGGGWLMRDRAARRREADNSALAALEVAEPRLRGGQPGDSALISAAQRVEVLLDSDSLGPNIRQRAEQLLGDVRMLANLDDIRLRLAESKDGVIFDAAGAEKRYADAFAAYGLDVAALQPSQAAAQVRQSAIREVLLAGLDAWIQLKPAQDQDRLRLRAVADGADDNAWRRTFREAALSGDTKQLQALAGQAEALTQPPAVLAWLGSVLDAAGLRNEAGVVLRQAQQRHPGDFWMNYNLGHFLIFGPQPHHPDEAVGYFRATVAIRPGSAEARSILGLALMLKGDTDGAVVAYRQAIALDPKLAVAHHNLGDALRAKRQLDEAIAEYREAVRLSPDWAEHHGGMGLVLYEKHRLDEAIAAFQEAIRLKKDYPRAHNNLGIALSDKGRLDEAVAEFQEAIRLKPDAPWAHYNLGFALCAKGRLDEAIAAFREVRRLKPDDPWAHYNLGCALRDKGRLDEAVAEFQEAIRLKKDYAEAHCNLGFALRAKGRLDEAIAAFREVRRLKPDDPWAHYNLGVALRAKGRLDEAIAEYQEAIRLKKDNALAHNSLAWLLATCPDAKFRDPPLAVQLAKKAIELQPKDGGSWNTLGVAHYRARDWKASIAALEKSMELRKGGDAFDWFFLAMAHWQLGHKDEARQWYDRAVEWMEKNPPKNEELKRFRTEAAELLGVKEKQ
jgi:tetratricopeptide (TPR) repeat protein/serine/threonine protein kinase